MAFARDGRSSAARGYDATHRAARAWWLARHHPSHPCCLCGHPLGPAGKHLHLDHCPACKATGRRGCGACHLGYRGLSHGEPCPTCGVRCNVVDGARRGRAKQDASPLRW